MDSVCKNTLSEVRLKFLFTFWDPVVAVWTTTFNIQTLNVLHTDCV